MTGRMCIPANCVQVGDFVLGVGAVQCVRFEGPGDVRLIWKWDGRGDRVFDAGQLLWVERNGE